jgi:threonylcarbamoyladenosine tRNA methylthiotransferase MtaB
VTRFIVRNFGCRASQADGAAIEAQLSNRGFHAVGDHDAADLVILNTCTVTSAADDEVRHIVRRVHRDDPDARIVVTGCYAQRAPDELISLPGVAMVVGNSHKTEISDLLSTPYHGQVWVSDIASSTVFAGATVENAIGDRSRPNLKIQDGCSNRCSFCIIPSVRGRSRSAPVLDIVEQVRHLAPEYPEIVLTGINLGRWGREGGGRMRLVDLLRMLLDETDVRRLRLSSVEPMDWSEDLLRLMADSPRICKHVHAPLQSGSDTVLRRMRRRYRRSHYESRIRLARELMPDAAIGADVMVGFPGETQAEFDATRAFIEAMPFTYLHVFPYSERPGTEAAALSQQIPSSIRKERGRTLKAISDAKAMEFRRRMAGSTQQAVTLQGGEAITANYLTEKLKNPIPPRRLITISVSEP